MLIGRRHPRIKRKRLPRIVRLEQPGAASYQAISRSALFVSPSAWSGKMSAHYRRGAWIGDFWYGVALDLEWNFGARCYFAHLEIARPDMTRSYNMRREAFRDTECFETLVRRVRRWLKDPERACHYRDNGDTHWCGRDCPYFAEYCETLTVERVVTMLEREPIGYADVTLPIAQALVRDDRLRVAAGLQIVMPAPGTAPIILGHKATLPRYRFDDIEHYRRRPWGWSWKGNKPQ